MVLFHNVLRRSLQMSSPLPVTTGNRAPTLNWNLVINLLEMSLIPGKLLLFLYNIKNTYYVFLGKNSENINSYTPPHSSQLMFEPKQYVWEKKIIYTYTTIFFVKLMVIWYTQKDVNKDSFTFISNSLLANFRFEFGTPNIIYKVQIQTFPPGAIVNTK